MDTGQGCDSVLAHTVAEELGVEPADVRLVTADTDTTPIDLGSYSSRVTFMAGNAALEAARRMRALLVSAVAEKMGVSGDLDEIEVGRGRIGDFDFLEACELAETRWGALSTAGAYTPPRIGGPFKGSGVGPSPAYSYSAAVGEGGAHERTGIVTARKGWIAPDIGRPIGPPLGGG